MSSSKKIDFKRDAARVYRIYRLEIQSVMLVFSTQLCELLHLSSSLGFNSPPFPVWIRILYTRRQCVRGDGEGYGVLGLRQINTCRKVPLQVNFIMTTFCIAFYESYLSTGPGYYRILSIGFAFYFILRAFCCTILICTPVYRNR